MSDEIKVNLSQVAIELSKVIWVFGLRVYQDVGSIHILTEEYINSDCIEKIEKTLEKYNLKLESWSFIVEDRDYGLLEILVEEKEDD